MEQNPNSCKVIILCILLLNVKKILSHSTGEFGSIECVDGKWKVDTRLMALVMTCPLPLDGNVNSVMNMAKCAMNKLEVYDGQNLSEDFLETVCNLFSPDLKTGCLSAGNDCADLTLVRDDWENRWFLFLGCFIPWAMQRCNI